MQLQSRNPSALLALTCSQVLRTICVLGQPYNVRVTKGLWDTCRGMPTLYALHQCERSHRFLRLHAHESLTKRGLNADAQDGWVMAPQNCSSHPTSFAAPGQQLWAQGPCGHHHPPGHSGCAACGHSTTFVDPSRQAFSNQQLACPSGHVNSNSGAARPSGHMQAHPGQSQAPAHSYNVPATGQPLNIYLNQRIDNSAHANAEATALARLRSTIKAKLRAAAGNPLVTAAVATVATLLLHNRLPIVRSALPLLDQSFRLQTLLPASRSFVRVNCKQG